MVRAALIGCGANADYHVKFARRYCAQAIVGVVDRDMAKADRFAQRHGIQHVFTDVADLVHEQHPDVVHVITPPATHRDVARRAIELKCHVLIEKPLALNADDARSLYDLAEEKQVLLCAMHNHYFDPCMLKARQMIESGQAGRIVHVDSHYGMNARSDALRKYPAPNVLPWFYDLPGGVFHDFLPHPLYVMLPFLGRVERIVAMDQAHGELPHKLSDELRILIRGEQAFGQLTVSFNAMPYHHFVRFYGTQMMIHVDFNTMTTTVFPISSLPKAAQKATYNLTGSRQLFFATVGNVWRFVRKKLRPYQGMQTLIHRFYDAVAGKGDVPVSRTEGLQVVEVMDAIWPQITHRRLDFTPVLPPADKRSPTVLVSGAAGFLGKRLVNALLQEGYRVRALARKLSHIEPLRRDGVEIYFGDVASPESLEPAIVGVDYVVHAAADTGGSEDEGKISTVQGTRNVLDFCQRHGVKKLVYISSCSVYGTADCRNGQTVTEDSPLERFPEKRGAYSLCKLEAERLVTQAMADGVVPTVCLRPGLIYGPGSEPFTPMMGFSRGDRLFVVIGNGRFVLPLVYVDNLCSAIAAAMIADNSTGETYNVIDPQQVTKREYMNRLVKRLHPRARTVYFPYGLLSAIVRVQEAAFRLMGRRPVLTQYRLTSSQKRLIFDASKIRQDLHWQPPVSVEQAFETLAAQRH